MPHTAVAVTPTLLATGEASQVAPNILSIAHRSRIPGGELCAPLSRVDWATLLRRTFDVDLPWTTCRLCSSSRSSVSCNPTMAFHEIEATLPRRLHDAYLEGLVIDDVETDHLLVAIGLRASAHGIEDAERDLRLVGEDLGGARIELRLAEERGDLLRLDHLEHLRDVRARGLRPGERLDDRADVELVALREVLERAVEGDEAARAQRLRPRLDLLVCDTRTMQA